MPYRVFILPAAEKELSKLDPQIRRRMVEAIADLAHDPKPPGSKKLVGMNARRIRVGDWRAVYQIQDDRLVVLVVRVGHRRDVYN